MSEPNDKLEPSCAFELVTPEMAKQWLDVNHRNRKLSDPSVRRLAGIIRRGEWMKSCTDAVGLDRDGGVINGQHRLTAIIESDQPIWMLVVRNVDPDVIKVIDQGLHRNFTQLLQMDGRWPNPGFLAGATEWLYRMMNDFERSIPMDQKPTVPQLQDIFNDHQRLVGSLDAALEVYKRFKVDRSMLVAYHYTMASVDPELADSFYDRLASGIDIMEGQPVHALREKYLAELTKADGKKEAKYVLAAWLVKAWEATRQDQTMVKRQLTFVKSGSRAEDFPKVTDVPWLPLEGIEQQELVA